MTRVRDVARVELAALDYSMNSKINGRPTASIAHFPVAGIELDRNQPIPFMPP